MELEYRLRIRDASTAMNPDGTADALTLTSVAGGTNPYITGPPSGDGQEVDPMSGRLREGAYVVRAIDPSTGTDGTGTIRLVTNQLEDATYRQQLLSRRCYLEYRQNGGAWTMLIAGYLNAIRLVSAIEYEFAIGDSRRVARNKRVFVRGFPTYGNRGAIFGGPVIGGFLGIKDHGGWTFRVVAVSGRQVQCAFVEGYAGPTGFTTRNVVEAKAQSKDSRVAKIDDLTASYASWRKLEGMTASWSYPDLRLKLSENGVANAGAHVPVPNAMVHGGVQIVSDIPMPSTGYHLTFQWDTTLGGAAPAVGAILRVSCYVDAVSEGSPLYIDTHPIDLVTALWDDTDTPADKRSPIAYDAASAAAVKARIGVDVRLALRVTESQLLTEFLERAVFGPFGVSARTNAAGALELFTTRLKDATTPALTVATADLRSGDSMVFDLDEATVVTSISIAHEVYTVAPDQTPDTDNPFDGVLKATSRVESSSGDTTAFGTKQVEFTIPGMVHLATSNEPDLSNLVAATAIELFDRFGRGAPAADVELLATAAAAAAKVGEELYVTVPHYPNKNYRIGESSVGARIMQLVRRTETPEGPRFKLVDSGLAQQPVAPAATISIAANAGDPTTVAEFTITNAAAINAAAVLQVAVEWATGALSPTDNGQDFTRYAAAACATGAVRLPPVTPGSTVWVRARTEQAGRRPSAWTAWVSVSLTGFTAPSALVVSAIKKTAATLAWTNGSATEDLEVFVYEGGAPPADWSPYRRARLVAGSTTTTIRALSGPTITYQVAVCHVAASGARSAFATSSFTTNSTLDALNQPIGLGVIPSVADASLPTGIVLALYPSNTSYSIVIERAPDSGSFSPGTFAELAVVGGHTDLYVDPLPVTGTIYWYRIRHRLGGYADSSPNVQSVSGVAGGVPPLLVRPAIPSAPLQVKLVYSDYRLISAGVYKYHAEFEISVWIGNGYNSIASSTVIYDDDDPRKLASLVRTVRAVGSSTSIATTQRSDMVNDRWVYEWVGNPEYNYTFDIAVTPQNFGDLGTNIGQLTTNCSFVIPAANGSLSGLSADLFGVIGDGTTNDTTAVQAAFDAAAAMKTFVNFGRKIVKLTGAVTCACKGFVFDSANYGDPNDPGFLVSGTGYTALTISGSPTYLRGAVYGTGNAANAIYFDNPLFAQGQKLRVYNLAGFGIKIEHAWDCVFLDISVEKCGSDAEYAFAIGTHAGDDSNQTHIGHLQVEKSLQRAIYIDANNLNLKIASIHSEQAICTPVTAGSFVTGKAYTITTLGTTNFTLIGASANTVGVTFVATGAGSGTGTATPVTWVLGGASSEYSVTRMSAIVTAGNFVVGNKYTIVTVGTTNFTAIGAASNTVGVVFTATGVGSGTGLAAGDAKAWLRGANTIFHSIRGELLATDLEALEDLSLTLIDANLTGVIRETPNQLGSLVFVAGNQSEIDAAWTGSKDRRHLLGQDVAYSWTPALKFGGGTTGLTYSARAGSYSRVGKLVTCTCDITLSAKGSSTGSATIEDLPFTVGTGKSGSGSLGYYVSLSGVAGYGLLVRADAATKTIVISKADADAAPTQLSDANFTNTSRLILTVSYFTD